VQPGPIYSAVGHDLMSQALQCQEFVKSNGCEIVGLSLFKLNLSTMFSTINNVAFFVIKMFVLS
jgi:hypothetical protein